MNENEVIINIKMCISTSDDGIFEIKCIQNLKKKLEVISATTKVH